MPELTSGEAEVDVAAIAINTGVACSRTRSTVMAVVKANGFGHGAVAVARTALAHGAGWLGVATTGEALALRAAGIGGPILCWLYHPSADLRATVAAGVHLSVASVGQLRAVRHGAVSAARTARIHLKIDTGLSRGGASADGWADLVRTARRYERAGLVTVHGLWSHLADADDPAGARVPSQLARFEAAVATAERAGLRPAVLHMANSAAALHRPETHLDMVRFGIGLYGVEPVPGQPAGLRPAMTLRAPIVLAKPVAAGVGVSYHHDYVTGAPTTLGLVPVGYADGLPRAAAGQAQVWVDGRRRPVAGRIAMDQFVVDLGSEDDADHVVIFGPGDWGEPTVTEWAGWAGTIPHEVLTGIGARVRRRCVGHRSVELKEGIRAC
ncbi:alanine racemase [Pseudonocardia sp. DSM 110487]|uniref:alanine racemase n=1 Tax=Pseudonocardia sp. DSM 110487 TaxID=2865833 RepID=UPI001C69BE3D|nr:alanine racemase [Pseudonocardia sp. DSM 110487]QYN33217.1 alanine racemase [Pseudonocardia sp. DSM 110487]